jgi:hypothetical protein
MVLVHVPGAIKVTELSMYIFYVPKFDPCVIHVTKYLKYTLSYH